MNTFQQQIVTSKTTIDDQFLLGRAQPSTTRLLKQHRQLKHFPNTTYTYDNVIRHLKSCYTVLQSAETIFNIDCSKEKKDLMFIMLQVDIFIYSYNASQSDKNDSEWTEIYKEYRRRSLGRFRQW